MPTISVNPSSIYSALGKEYTDEELDELCFDFGIEVETDEEEEADGSKKKVLKFELPANRSDLLCVEGLTLALQIFLGKTKPPKVEVKPAKVKMEVRDAVDKVRPYVCAAVLRDVTFTEEAYKSFIDLQEKLHHNIGRRRTLVSIGTHDLDTIKGPYIYDAKPPKEINFVPLSCTKKFSGDGLLEFIETDLSMRHLQPYVSLLKGKDTYPVITDSNGVVLSLPPIINGDHSKISLSTKNVLIEVTALDETKAKVVLNTVASLFSVHCKEKFTVEAVELIRSGGKKEQTPDLSSRPMTASVSYILECLGLSGIVKPPQVVELLSRMWMPCSLSSDSSSISVSIPPTRADVMHECDIMEDVGIAYGFNKLPWIPPKTNTFGKQQPLNKLSDILRQEVAMAGYTEVLTLSLCSNEENFGLFNQKDDGKTAVVLQNPKTVQYQEGRTVLLGGILKTLAHNRSLPLPLKLFEVSDVVRQDPTTETGAVNKRHLALLRCGVTGGFELVHGTADLIMTKLGVPVDPENGYVILSEEDPTYLPGKCGKILYKGKKIGTMGVLHPTVLHNFDISFPCCALEMEVEPFL